MKKLGLVVLGLSVWGLLAAGQGCAPCGQPAQEPPCYTAFWEGEDIWFELVLPWSWCCCCCQAPQVQVTGWRVVDWNGNIVYQEAFPSPQPPGKWVWKQVDASGNPVPPGYYKIVVSTTTGEYENTVKIVAKTCCCQCCFPCFFFSCWWTPSKPCPLPWCTPYVKLYRCPTCVVPCCGVTIYLGAGDP